MQQKVYKTIFYLENTKFLNKSIYEKILSNV